MKATGIIRRTDDLGRVAIPKEIRRSLGIVEGSPLEIFIDTSTHSLILTPYYSNISSKIQGLAATLNSLGRTPEEWEISEELKNIAKKLEEIENRG